MKAEVEVIRAPRAKECGRILEAGKGRDLDSPQEPPEGTGPADTLILALFRGETYFGLLTSKTVRY